MSGMEDLDEHRAQRYAEAIATAAAAEEKIAVLTEQVKDHEWARTQAETVAAAVEWDGLLGKVWSTGEPPPDDVEYLLDLSGGAVWEREKRQDGTVIPNGYWIRLEKSLRGQTRYGWPIEDGGPFILFRQAWDWGHVLREQRRLNEEADAAHRILRDKPGYDWQLASRDPLPDVIERVLRAQSEADLQRRDLIQRLTAENVQLRALCDAAGVELEGRDA